MQILPRFEIFDHEVPQTGSFQLTDLPEEAEELFMEADDLYFEMESQHADKLLKKIISDYPSFVDAHILLAQIARDENRKPEAINILKNAAGFFEKVIPDGFDGELHWGFTDNRPYLTLLHELMITYDRFEQFENALSIGEKILAYNPNDNQGIRWLMGDLYLRCEDLKKAETYLKKCAPEYPPNRYSYALLLMKQDKRWDAITQFRLGFVENIYICEMLRFKAPFIRYDVYEPSNLNGMEVAQDYVLSMMDYWMIHMEALQMMNDLLMTTVVTSEINGVFHYLSELNETFLFDDPISSFDDPDDLNVSEMQMEARREIFEEIEAIKKHINTASSKKILKELDQINPNY